MVFLVLFASSSGLFMADFFFLIFALDPRGCPGVLSLSIRPVGMDDRSGDESEAEIVMVSLAVSLSGSEKLTRLPKRLRKRPEKYSGFFHV